MQVVVPTGSTAYLTITGKLAGDTWTLTDVAIPTPEPSTILMLLAGSLCLLAVRSRK